jgi:hypothetical protein
VGDGFLIAATEDGVAVRKLWLDGSLGTLRRPFPCWNTELPRLAWNGSEALITFQGADTTLSFGGGVYWARLNADGTAISPAQFIGLQLASAPAPVVSLGSDTLMLVEVGPNASTDGTSTPSGYYSVRLAKGGTVSTTQITTTDSWSFEFENFPDLVVEGTAAFTAGVTSAAPYRDLFSGGVRHDPGRRPLLAQIR